MLAEVLVGVHRSWPQHKHMQADDTLAEGLSGLQGCGQALLHGAHVKGSFSRRRKVALGVSGRRI